MRKPGGPPPPPGPLLCSGPRGAGRGLSTGFFHRVPHILFLEQTERLVAPWMGLLFWAPWERVGGSRLPLPATSMGREDAVLVRTRRGCALSPAHSRPSMTFTPWAEKWEVGSCTTFQKRPPSNTCRGPFSQQNGLELKTVNSLTQKWYPWAQHFQRWDLAAERGRQRPNCGTWPVTLKQVIFTEVPQA